MVRPDAQEPLSAFLDTNVLVRHLTGDPPHLARRATLRLKRERELELTDIVAAECVYVLESVYKVSRYDVAELMRAVLSFRSVQVTDEVVLYRALEIYETANVHFAEAHLAASAEVAGSRRIVSFDRDIDRIAGVERVDP